MNNFITIARMLKIANNAKSAHEKQWAIAQGKAALLQETTLNPIV